MVSFQKGQIILVVQHLTVQNHQFHNEFLVLLIYRCRLVTFLYSHLFIIFSLPRRCLPHHLIYEQILQLLLLALIFFVGFKEARHRGLGHLQRCQSRLEANQTPVHNPFIYNLIINVN